MRSDGTITIGAKIDTKEFDKQIDYIESRMEEIEYLLKQADLGFEVGDTQKLESEYEKLSNRLIDLRRRKQDVKEEPLDDGVSNSNFEKGIEKITKKITRMGLAMIGIRSLYGMISSSVSRITEENPQLQAQIDAIRNAIDNIVVRLVNLLLPVIEFIVGLIGKLLKSLFGIDIFAQSFNKNMKSANGTITKMRKQLMGFDEMNILNSETGSTGIGGIGGGSVSTDVKFNIDEASLKNIYQKVKDFFIKLPIPINLDYVGDMIQNPKEYIKGAGEIIQKSVDEWGGVGGGIAELIFGSDSFITKGIKAINKSTLGIIPSIVEGGKKIWNALFGGEDEKDFTNILQNIDNMSDKMKEFLHLPDDFSTKNIIKEFKGMEVKVNNGVYTIKTKTGKTMQLTEKQYKQFIDSIEKYTTSKYPEIAEAINEGNYKIQDGLVQVKLKSGEVVEYTIDEFENLKRKLNDVGTEGKNSADTTKKSWFSKVNEIIAKTTGKDQNGLVGAVTGAFTSIQDDSNNKGENTKKNWFSSITDMINKFTGKDSNSFLGAVTGAFNDIPDSAEDNTNDALNSITNLIKKFKPPSITGITLEPSSNGLQTKVNNLLKKVFGSIGINFNFTIGATSVSGGKHGAKGLIFNPPKLARGGIINRPGRGVNYRSAIIGERGREAVVPLTDSQQMSLLGQEIAKNVVINLTNVTELDGRVLARNVTQVMNDMNFASNGGVI